MDWHDYLIRRNARIPKKEIEEQTYDYQCKRCREVRDKASSKRKEKMEAQANEQ